MNRVLVGVFTAWQFQNRRRRVRETWMRDLQGLAGVDAVFLFGTLQIPTPERAGDMLFLPCPNSYPHLPQRTRLFCQWALTQPDWDVLVKIDDDCRLSVDRLMAYDMKGADYIGAEWKPGVGYGSGNGYVLSRRAASVVAEKLANWEGCEDVLVGQVLREAGIPLTIDNEHFHVLAEPNDAPGPHNNWIYASPTSRDDC